MSLPTLPKELARFAQTQSLHCALNDLVQAYGQACRAEALEEAAGVIEADIYPAPLTAYQKQYNTGVALRVSKIRSLKS